MVFLFSSSSIQIKYSANYKRKRMRKAIYYRSTLYYRCMLVVLFLVNSIQVSDAQSWQEYLEQLSEQEESEDMNWESYEDILEGYAENPINLNTATKEDLEQFPFLSAQRIRGYPRPTSINMGI